jgi:23S rRNA pseudouridine955/2504/2580 synthase
MNKSNDFSKPQIWTIDADHAGQRVDNFLISRLKGLPKSHLYRILRKGEVRVNKKRIKPDYRLQAKDNLRIPPLRLSVGSEAPPIPSQSAQSLLTQRILYEDANLLVINKPAGMAVHGGSGINFGVIEALRHMRPKERNLELVHRLDRDTSGCLLLAKKPSILKQLHELMRNGHIEKLYVTLVKGYWPKDRYSVDAPLKKYELRSGERMVNVHPEGKTALTEFQVIKRFATTTLLEAHLKTGRTHQIRVHAKHVGHPVVGDEKYGDKEFNKELRKQGCKRLFLHASSLAFTLPEAEQPIKVTAELDADLQACLARLL